MFHSDVPFLYKMGYFKYVIIAKTLFLLSSRTFFEMAPKLSKQYSTIQYKPLLRFRMMCFSIGPGSLVFFFSFNQRFNNHYQALVVQQSMFVLYLHFKQKITRRMLNLWSVVILVRNMMCQNNICSAIVYIWKKAFKITVNVLTKVEINIIFYFFIFYFLQYIPKPDLCYDRRFDHFYSASKYKTIWLI